MWKCKVCKNIYRVFNFQCHKQQIKKERIKKVIRNRSLYHVIKEQEKLKKRMSKTFTKTFINLKSLMSNSLKRKLRCLMNESRLLNATVTSENTIMNHLIKKTRLNKLKSTLFTSLSESFFVENLTDEANASQTFKRTLSNFECELWCFNKKNFEYYSTTFTSLKTKWW